MFPLLLMFQTDITTSFNKILDDILLKIPKVMGFLGFIILAWVVIKLLLFIIRKALNKTKIDEWSKKLSNTKIFGNSTINVVLTNVVLAVVKWMLILIFTLIGADVFGLTIVSEGIGNFIAYLPKFLTSLAIFVGGVYLATIAKKAVQGMFKSLEISGGNLVGNIVFYFIVVFISISALDQAGIDTSIIKSNVILIIGAVLLSFTIAFGLGARDVILRLLFSFYSRKNFKIGQNVAIKNKGIEGVIESIDNICIVLKTATNERVVLPIKELVDEIVEIR